ncbi:PGG domain-containing protein [Hirschfeldia incana]|nr:PGG domain-containing protein [Hirschfeldia incana]
MEINSEANQPDESSTRFTKYLDSQADWLEKTRGNLMVAATVIAGMSFQVMINPPGGVWQSDICSSVPQTNDKFCKDRAGTSVLGDNSSKRLLYHGMIISSTISFSASMSLILLFFSGFLLRNRVIMAVLVMFMVAAVLCISAAFFFAVALVQPHDPIIISMLAIYFGFWVLFLILIILIQLIRFLCWLICLICCCRPCRRRSPRRFLPSTPTPTH